jgi:hypothetical protein
MFYAAIAAQADIAAPADHVWSILADLPRYREWNPFTTEVESTLEVGTAAVLHVQMRPHKALVQRETVSAFEPGVRLSWKMQLGTSLLLAAERCQVLSPLPGGGTRYYTCDEFRGVLVPLIMRLYGADIQRGFDGVAHALKRRAEGTRVSQPLRAN